MLLEEKGLISRDLVKAELSINTGSGIRFCMPEGAAIEANYQNISSTQRNTVLEKSGEYVCLTEHFMCAAALLGVDNVDLKLSHEELPFGDGGAQFWVDFLQVNNFGTEINTKYKLTKEILIEDEQDPSRYIRLSPAETFKATYQLDWNHPKIGKQVYTWSRGDDIAALAKARTFSNEAENQMLGLSGWVVGLTKDDFSMPLLFEDEPVRHKVLDLIGDLYLSGVNPLMINMHVISHKAGHALNSRAATILGELFA